MRIVALLIGPILGCAVPRIAHAAPGQSSAEEAPDDAPPTPQRRWYGWQTFTADGVAAALFVGAVADDQSTPLFGASALTFGLGAPVVHLAHGQWEMAICSVGVRIAAPLVGALIGSQQDVHRSSDGSLDNVSSTKWTTAGVAVGGLAASAIDGFLLAYDPRPLSRPAPRVNRLLWNAVPQLTLRPRGLGLGYSVTF